jgi:guanylate kinase
MTVAQPAVEHAQSLVINNPGTRPLKVVLEPWYRTYTVKPDDYFEIAARGPSPGNFEVIPEVDGAGLVVTVWMWRDAEAQIVHGLEDVEHAQSTNPPLAGMLLVLTGPSGVGKDTLLDALVAADPTFVRAKTATTRPPRGEDEREHYHFLDRDDFERGIREGRFLEHAEYVEHLYGVPADEVIPRLSAGLNVAVRTEVAGARALKALFPDAVVVFVSPPSLQELELRIGARAVAAGREVDALDLAGRIAKAREELEAEREFDYVIVNPQGRQDRAQFQLQALAQAESMRRRAP